MITRSERENFQLRTIITLGLIILAVVFTTGDCTAAITSGSTPGPTNSTNLLKAPSSFITSNSSEKDRWDKINVVAAIVSGVGTMLAAFFAWVATIQAREAARQTRETAVQTNEAAKQAERTARELRLAELFTDFQKLAFLTDEELSRLEETSRANQSQMIDADVALGKKISLNANLLEKIAFCWKYNLVEKSAIEEELKDDYVPFYDQIAELPNVIWLNRDGKELVKGMPAAYELYRHMVEK